MTHVGGQPPVPGKQPGTASETGQAEEWRCSLRTVGSRVQPGHTQELSRPHEHQRRRGTKVRGSGEQVQHPPYKAVWGATMCGCVPEGGGGGGAEPAACPHITKGSMTTGAQHRQQSLDLRGQGASPDFPRQPSRSPYFSMIPSQCTLSTAGTSKEQGPLGRSYKALVWSLGGGFGGPCMCLQPLPECPQVMACQAPPLIFIVRVTY